jgi:hypothetical protein
MSKKRYFDSFGALAESLSKQILATASSNSSDPTILGVSRRLAELIRTLPALSFGTASKGLKGLIGGELRFEETKEECFVSYEAGLFDDILRSLDATFAELEAVRLSAEQREQRLSIVPRARLFHESNRALIEELQILAGELGDQSQRFKSYLEFGSTKALENTLEPFVKNEIASLDTKKREVARMLERHELVLQDYEPSLSAHFDGEIFVEVPGILTPPVGHTIMPAVLHRNALIVRGAFVSAVSQKGLAVRAK